MSHGIRLDTNYYYWPPDWINDRPGFFTGSGMPMRFATANGTMVDVYQATTQMTDKSGQGYPFTINTLLDRALGAEGYYGAFTTNIHTDGSTESQAAAIVASAKARSVPVVSAKQMLTWLYGRNGSSFEDIALAKTVCGEDKPSGIAEWAQHRLEWLCEVLKLERKSMPHRIAATSASWSRWSVGKNWNNWSVGY